ncbi:MAG TPA: molybdopterin-dependent oxidoreductase [Rhizomicrobium sp.]|nr:molybdopterin-dependent oxidoreductase [Rhizomicrobium sp.]
MKLTAIALAIAAFAFSANAQDAPTVTISGAVQHPLTLTLSDLQKMPAVDVTVSQQTDHGPAQGRFHGVLLWTIIDKAGLVSGSEKNAYLGHTILVSGSDKYAAAVSEGEIDPNLEGKQIILATAKDGAPLDKPRLVVPLDAHASRSVHDVATIEVK